MTSRLIVYMHPFQISRSRSAYDLAADPLAHYADIEVRAWEPDLIPSDESGVRYLFSQWLPSDGWLRRHAERVIWLPMWDNQRVWCQHQWNALPKALRVVAFSEAAARRARAARLRTLRLQFFQNPDSFPPADHARRTLLYWNRTGLVSAAFLRRFVEVMRVEHVIFRDQIDPAIPHTAYYAPPDRIGNATIEPLPVTEDRDSYWRALARASLFIAPRAYEGAGNAFIEALASGCAVFAHNAPTMNEYITHGRDGALFASAARPLFIETAQRAAGRVIPRLKDSRPLTRLSLNQQWKALARLDLARIGAAARARHTAGHAAWRAAQTEYARFVLNDVSIPS